MDQLAQCPHFMDQDPEASRPAVLGKRMSRTHVLSPRTGLFSPHPTLCCVNQKFPLGPRIRTKKQSQELPSDAAAPGTGVLPKFTSGLSPPGWPPGKYTIGNVLQTEKQLIFLRPGAESMGRKAPFTRPVRAPLRTQRAETPRHRWRAATPATCAIYCAAAPVPGDIFVSKARVFSVAHRVSTAAKVSATSSASKARNPSTSLRQQSRARRGHREGDTGARGRQGPTPAAAGAPHAAATHPSPQDPLSLSRNPPALPRRVARCLGPRAQFLTEGRPRPRRPPQTLQPVPLPAPGRAPRTSHPWDGGPRTFQRRAAPTAGGETASRAPAAPAPPHRAPGPPAAESRGRCRSRSCGGLLRAAMAAACC